MNSEHNDRPSWLIAAFSHLGLWEWKGSEHNPKILEWWRKIRAPFTDDETPWCAAFVGGVLEECGIKSSRSAAARSYTKWGFELPGPAVGAIVVFWRGKPVGRSGHVGFVIGKDQGGNLMVLGGNQGNQVTVRPFDTSRVLSYHWPDIEFHPERIGFANLPVVEYNGRLLTNET